MRLAYLGRLSRMEPLANPARAGSAKEAHMRTRRITASILLVLSLTVVPALTPVAIASGTPEPIGQVMGTLDVHQLPGGTFDVENRVFQYRDFHVAGSGHQFSDPRLSGYLISDWNWDVQSSGGRPIPAWGHIEIATPDGSWAGDFTGIRRSDYEPVAIRALLFGTEAYEGLCATLDISGDGIAEASTWFVDGIVHPVAMSG